MDESSNDMLALKVQKMFEGRSNALLTEDRSLLKSLYDEEIRYSVWAYEHELKKMRYLNKWSDKQGVNFIEINPEVVVRRADKKEDGYALNLLVSTEYKYVYQDSSTSNSFRIGTYHSLDLMPREDRWVITREWYKDPFADSLELDQVKNQEIKDMILSGEEKDLSDLNQRRVEAVEYVDRYSGAASLPEYGFQYNPEYRNYNPLGGDCANFASQMLHEGGGIPEDATWRYERGSGSRAWVNAHAFNQHMIYSGRATRIARGSYEQVLNASYKLLPGDYVAYEKGGTVDHISVVTGMDSKGYALVNSHNVDRHRVPWDLGWSDQDIKFWLVRVHY
ncbi:amidase domain-containing protein [Natroniella sulfidigena]|uniref:amidase domain-containing protein n=1 Tax=Natroniella sulfidigena TaxID=723921 RepID=UPI002009E589|nr:amidase domain-containing protein [Natroniella sulfidigena]MCK8817440.1 amidase domain-containing protein [Natroniella sulfidigena]